MSVDLYLLPLSSPCRAVLLTAKAVGVEINPKTLDVLKGEQMKPEFLAINPEHTIPTMVDGDFILWESRPICTYLVSQYGKDDALYPTDPKVRAKIDRMLYFDMGTLFQRFGAYVMPVLFGGEDKFNPENLEKVHEALGYLNEAMKGNQWAVTDNITVADHALAATMATIESVDIEIGKHSNVATWLAKCKSSMPGYTDLNDTGAKDFGNLVKSKLGDH